MTREYIIEDHLLDILSACRKAREFVEGMTRDEFLDDERTQFAVIRALEIVGEASRRIPEAIRRQHPDIPWRAMTGMRDKLIHDYFGVSLEIVWETIFDDLPKLAESIQCLLPRDNKRSPLE